MISTCQGRKILEKGLAKNLITVKKDPSVREIPFETLETSAHATLEKAQKAMAEGYFHYARALSFAILERYPNCPELRQLVRQATVALNDRPLFPLFAFVRTWAVRLFYISSHRTFKLLNALERVLMRAPGYLPAHRAFAAAAMRKQLWQTATLSLETIITLNPADSHSTILLSKAYMQLGRVPEAQGLIAKVLELTPHHETAQELNRQLSIHSTLGRDDWNR